MNTIFTRPPTGPLMSSLFPVHNPHSANCKRGKLENRNLVMSFPSKQHHTQKRIPGRGREYPPILQLLWCSLHSRPPCTVPFVGLASLKPISLVTLPVWNPLLQSCAADFLLCTITLPKDFLDLSGWNTQESTHLLHSSFQHKLHKNWNVAVLS